MIVTVDGGKAICNNTKWQGGDITSIVCTALGETWLNSGELVAFGGYSVAGSQTCGSFTTGGIDCCGDDANEYNLTGNDGKTVCCNSPTDCVDSTGACRDGVENTYDLCTDCHDNNCDGTIDVKDKDDCFGSVSGWVKDESNDYIIEKAVVIGSPAGLTSEHESNATTNFNGDYNIASAFVGTYNFVAKKDGYVDVVKNETVLSKQSIGINFWMGTGISCHDDCTDNHGNCNPACEGVTFGNKTNCTFINPVCYNRPKNFVATLDDGIDITEFTCCEGPTNKYIKLKPEVTGTVDNLYDLAFPIMKDGRMIKMHILVWKK